MKHLAQTIIVLLFLASTTTFAAPSKGLAGLSADDIANYHFVLVGGLNNESVPHYFTALERVLKANGAIHISTIMPSSLQTVTGNVPRLRHHLLNAYREAPDRPLIIIAHSKGGLEVGNTLGHYASEFPASVVAKAVFANVPFQGSPYTHQSIKEFVAHWGWGFNAFNPVYLNALSVLKSLETDAIRNNLEESFRDLSRSEIKSLSDRFFYFRTEQTAENVSGALKKSADYLADHGNLHNDGIIPVENQKLDSFAGLRKFGHDLGVMKDASHTDLFAQDRPTAPDQSTELTAFVKTVTSANMQAKLRQNSCSQLFR